MELYRCSYVPGWLGWSKTMNRKLFQSRPEMLSLLTNFNDSWKLSLPNLRNVLLGVRDINIEWEDKGVTIIHHQGRCWAWNQWSLEAWSFSFLVECKRICFVDSRMLSHHHISPTSTWRETKKLTVSDERAEWSGELWVPVGWIDFRASEESCCCGFTNPFNPRNQLVHELRRHFFRNGLSCFLIRFII